MDIQCALALVDTLERRRLVDLNVLSILIVVQTERVPIKNAVIRVRVLAVKTLNVPQ